MVFQEEFTRGRSDFLILLKL